MSLHILLLCFTLFFSVTCTVFVSAQQNNTVYHLLPGSTVDGWLVTNVSNSTTGEINPTIIAAAGSNVTFSLETTAHSLALRPNRNIYVGKVEVTASTGCSQAARSGTTSNSFYQLTNGVPCLVNITVPEAGTTWWYNCGDGHVLMQGRLVSVGPVQNNSASMLIATPALIVVLATITAAAHAAL